MNPETITAIEDERQRIAAALEEQVIGQINLLISQINIYEQTMRQNPQAHMAMSILGQLTRQLMQQARDLESDLHPTVLESLGLEAAIESLAAQKMRSYGVQVALSLARLRDPLLPQVQTTLFRAVQESLDRAIRQRNATRITLQLHVKVTELFVTISDNGLAPSADVLLTSRQQIEALGGSMTMHPQHSGLTIEIQFPIDPIVELTDREEDVLYLLVKGLTNKEMALALQISPRTVKFHLDNVYSKLNVHTRTEAVIYAMRRGWTLRRGWAPSTT